MSKTPAERQRESRQRKRDIVTPQNVTCHETDVTKLIDGVPADIAEAVIKAGTATLEHYHANPDKYIPRSEPDKLNWGPWMSSDELSRAGLKANRVSIPGDWDFAGVGVKGEV